jgi:hypothetical protein
MADTWRFGPVSEADFEPLLALRIDVMREHLERVFRYKPERARRIFREHFDEPGLRLILVDGERAGCVGFRICEGEIKIDSFYLGPRFQNRGSWSSYFEGAAGGSRRAASSDAARSAARQSGRPLL